MESVEASFLVLLGGIGSGSGGGVGGGMFSAGRNSVAAAAEGQELGDLFEYKLKERVTIHKNESVSGPDRPDARGSGKSLALEFVAWFAAAPAGALADEFERADSRRRQLQHSRR